MKLVTKIALSTAALLLAGCSSSQTYPDAEKVNCRGQLNIGAISKLQEVRLVKRDIATNRFYAIGNAKLGIYGWQPADTFDQIVCVPVDKAD